MTMPGRSGLPKPAIGGSTSISESKSKETAVGFIGINQVGPPAGLRTQLRPYQLEGLDWMQWLRKWQLGGILADDMGLGKTIQAIAHLLKEKESGRATGPSLIVCPTSVAPN